MARRRALRQVCLALTARPGRPHPSRKNRATCNGRDQMRPFSPDQREEFERIALVYHEVLLRVACRILRSESLAEDAVQEVACLNESVTSPLGRFADIATAVTTCRRLMLVTNSVRPRREPSSAAPSRADRAPVC